MRVTINELIFDKRFTESYNPDDSEGYRKIDLADLLESLEGYKGFSCKLKAGDKVMLSYQGNRYDPAVKPVPATVFGFTKPNGSTCTIFFNTARGLVAVFVQIDRNPNVTDMEGFEAFGYEWKRIRDSKE